MALDSTRVALVLACVLVGACGDAKTPPPLGSECDTTEECGGSGVCLQGLCLAPDGDEDGDTLPNTVEGALGTNLFQADSDGDGLTDRDEVTTDLKAKDTDGDGTQDALESDLSDSDGDCTSDQRDPDETSRDALLASLCKQVGVCAGATFSVSCTDAKAATCDYGAVTGYEAEESVCDQLDNDCDGDTDEGLAGCHGDLVRLELVPTEPIALEVGATTIALVIANYEDTTQQDVTSGATWESSAPAVATVDAGIIRAIGAGEATISARFGGLSATLSVVVSVPVPMLMVISVDDASTPLGVGVSFSARGLYDDGALLPLTGVTWRSTNEAVATVDADGDVTTVAVGTTNIVARLGDIAGNGTLTVTAPEPVSVDVVLTTETPRVAFEGATQLRAFAVLTDGNEADYSTRVTWRTSDATRATVDDAGLVTGRGLGPVDITAELDGVLSTLRLDVVVALVPLIAKHDVRATRLGSAATAVSPTVRALRIGPASVVVGRPAVRVEHTP